MHDKRASRVCALVILLMILITLFSFFSIFKKAVLSEPIETLPDAAHRRSESHLITQHHLFGEYLEHTLATSPAPSNLSLQAIFYSKNPAAKSSALISDNNEPGKLYYLSDTLPNGIKIQNILADKVLLSDGGKLQTLELPIPRLEFAPPPENTLPKE